MMTPLLVGGRLIARGKELDKTLALPNVVLLMRNC